VPGSQIGQTFWIIGMVFFIASFTMGGLNFVTTIINLRTKGLSLLRMPLTLWSMFLVAVLGLLAFPALTGASLMLLLDRHFGTSFFLPTGLVLNNAPMVDANGQWVHQGGSPLLWQHLFWFLGHPEVYILILPFFGVITEVVSTFSRKPVFGYVAFVFATIAIASLSMAVWAHHMFTTGAVYLPFFSLMTFLIAVPTGVKMFNWIFTLWRGKLTFSTPLLFALGFLSMFLLGGINGAFSAAVPVDFALQDTYWVVAHLHYVLFGGSVFGVFAGVYYWFPKMTGRMLNESLGKLQFVMIFIGFNLTFFPMHQLGLAGMPRRIADYASNVGWNDLNLAASIGGFVIAASMIPFLWNVFISLRNGKIAGDDPWQANTLEWATSSPPPPYNFDHLPEIRSERPLFDLRHGRTGH